MIGKISKDDATNIWENLSPTMQRELTKYQNGAGGANLDGRSGLALERRGLVKKDRVHYKDWYFIEIKGQRVLEAVMPCRFGWL